MAAKKVWVTWMPGEGSAEKPDAVLKVLSRYGLEVTGNNWIDNLDKVAWHSTGEALLDAAKANLWLIAGKQDHFATPTKRYGLSLLASVVREARGPAFPMVCLGLDCPLSSEGMPTPLAPLLYISTTDQSWPAKVVAEAFSTRQQPLAEYRLMVHADPHFGQWFEIGPRAENWTGVMFGVDKEGTITHQGVGPSGQVPSRTVVEYPVKNMKAQIGDTEFTAWSVQNKLSPADSYYAKVQGFPAKIIFGGHPGDDQAEVFAITLK